MQEKINPTKHVIKPINIPGIGSTHAVEVSTRKFIITGYIIDAHNIFATGVNVDENGVRKFDSININQLKLK